jgi:hypothetical protein
VINKMKKEKNQMSKLILTAAAAAVFSLVTFEGAYAGEKDVATTKGYAAPSDAALNKGDVATTPDTTPEKGFAVDQQSLSKPKNEPEGKVTGEKPSHGSAVR